MNRLKRSPLHGGVFAVAASAVALFLTFILAAYLQPDIFVFFLAAAWVSAWLYGRMGGLVATACSAVAIVCFFLRPTDGTTPPWSIVVRVSAFVLLSGLVTWMTAAWREGRRLFSATLSGIADAVVVADPDGRVTFLNPVAETLTGWARVEAVGKRSDEVLKLLAQQGREPVESPVERALRERILVGGQQPATLVSRSGSEAPVEYTASPVRDDSGELQGAVLVFRDISKRLQLEQQATHASKMEAVGRLAGGVAGDFNNVLTVVTGYAELLRAEIPASNPMRRFVDEIIYAGERAAALTRHLLAFSRGATAQARVLDLNTVISNMEPMLRRLLGQNIELILLATPGIGRIKADPAQIEQVIVNLATNSRDAMPGGGKLILETANVDVEAAASQNLGVKPGPYVMLAVSDTGVGMDPETRSRLFEPFFTTKAPGGGSGLGLATVYGAIKQADGHVTVYSQPNCGTIFEVYLPRVKEAIAEPVRKGSAKGSETILLVDDEEGVRKLVYAVLKSHGYDVMEAANGVAALAAYEKNGHKVDMVLTDVVMPQMSGFELGKQLGERTPGLKILYMSGFRDNAIGGATGDAPRAFLHKPFTPDVLLSKVREVLDNAPV
jgi:two-component system, cell cycle sensor histidine kinase and response regulator CckA